MSETIEKAYPFDAPNIEITLIGKPADPDKPDSQDILVYHRLRKPTNEEVFEWEKSQAAYEQKEISAREMEVISDDEVGNSKLWRKLILEIKGYNFNKDGLTDWRPMNDALVEQMPVGHKLAAIMAMYKMRVTVREDDDADGFVVGQPEWVVEQRVGSEENHYLITHVFREPTEPESRDFRKGHASTIKIGGSRKGHTKVTTHIKSHIKLYDALILRIESGGREVGKQMVDPVFKQRVISVFVNRLEAQIQD